MTSAVRIFGTKLNNRDIVRSLAIFYEVINKGGWLMVDGSMIDLSFDRIRFQSTEIAYVIVAVSME